MSMLGRSLALLAVAGGCLSAAEGLVELLDPLDEPERYCVDVPGFGRRLNLDAPLMAHTCKPGAPDELFTPNHPESGQLYMQAYDLCVVAGSDRPGSVVRLEPCGSGQFQRFVFEGDGRIRLAETELCLAVAPGQGTPTGGPSHLRRDLSLEACADAEPSLSRWRIPPGE